MLRGRGGVPVHQELDGDLEGSTSRPDQAQTGLDLPLGTRGSIQSALFPLSQPHSGWWKGQR